MVLVIGIGAFLFTELQRPEPIYMATAAVKFERASTIAGLFMEVLAWSPGDPLATQAEVIRSYPVMEGVAKEIVAALVLTMPKLIEDSQSKPQVVVN